MERTATFTEAPSVFNTDFDKPARILLIDADVEFCRSLSQKFEAQNHSVSIAHDGQAALEKLRAERAELIVCEVLLPDMSGIELCRRIKSQEMFSASAVVFLSACAKQDIQIESTACGASDFLLKPIEWPLLLARVSAALRHQRVLTTLHNAHADLEARVRARTAELVAANSRLREEIDCRVQIEAALRESEERYALAARGANDGLWDWNLETSAIYFSPRWKSMLGYKPEELGSHPDEWFKRVHSDDVEGLKLAVRRHLDGEMPHLQHEYRMLYKDGTLRWMLCRGLAIRDAQKVPYRMAGSQTDVTESKLTSIQLLHNAFHDELTSLANRALFMDRLEHALQRMLQRALSKFAVLFVDIDRFKAVNDSLGTRVGNHLLIAFGQRVKKCLRPTDTIARMGGDEFAILLEDVRSLGDASALANSVHESLKKPFLIGSNEIFINASVGIVLSKPAYKHGDDVIRDADIALHHAKALGKARQETFQSGMHSQVVMLLHLENDLRRAIDSKEFCLEYQPIIALPTGRIVEFEALLRWRRPARQILPAEFVPLAEETDLITPITMWVVREACRQLRIWNDRFPDRKLIMSVNLSPKALSPQNLQREIAQALQEFGVPGAQLNLEITEGMLMDQTNTTLAILQQLKNMDLRLTIDDFGTGYSSLSYLHRLPVDALKIDRSFVSNMGMGGRNSEIVRTIKALAGNLGMHVVAEGVETMQQLARLRELSCEFAQGYYFSKPVTPDVAEKLLAANKTW